MPVEDLPLLADDIRQFLIQTCSVTGGHIGANLGTIELTIALHRIFDHTKDTIIFDTGHQGYTHKILTGRADQFATLNTLGGMSRFLSRSESPHDAIEASHAGTSISMGLGIALAKRLRGDKSRTVVVIGDGSLAEGMALEGLNHALVEKCGLIILVNYNGYAISPGFGELHNRLSNVSEFDTIDGHDLEDMCDAFSSAQVGDRRTRVYVVMADRKSVV